MFPQFLKVSLLFSLLKMVNNFLSKLNEVSIFIFESEDEQGKLYILLLNSFFRYDLLVNALITLYIKTLGTISMFFHSLDSLYDPKW